MDMMMRQKEAKRGQVMEQLLADKIDPKEAGCQRAPNQAYLATFRTSSLPGLISKQRGRVLNPRNIINVVTS